MPGAARLLGLHCDCSDPRAAAIHGDFYFDRARTGTGPRARRGGDLYAKRAIFVEELGARWGSRWGPAGRIAGSVARGASTARFFRLPLAPHDLAGWGLPARCFQHAPSQPAPPGTGHG